MVRVELFDEIADMIWIMIIILMNDLIMIMVITFMIIN